MAKVSIVMPAYNAANYLPRMVDSIINQTLTDWELIAVDDGSTDRTYDILAEYSRNDSRIIVIHQENKGCGSSRCTALRQVVGDYVVCLDSDDWLEPDYLETLYNTALSRNADIVWCDAYKDCVEYWSFCFKEEPYEIIKANLLGEFQGYVWNKVTKKEIALQSIKYLEGCQVGEDNVYSIVCWVNCKSIAYVPKALYHYNTNNAESIMHTSINAAKQSSLLISIQHISAFFEEKGVLSIFEYELIHRKLKFLLDYVDNPEIRDLNSFVSVFPEASARMNEYSFYPKRLKIAYWLINHKLQILVPLLCSIDGYLRSKKIIH